MDHSNVDSCYFKAEGEEVAVLHFDGEIEEASVVKGFDEMYDDPRFVTRRTFVFVSVAGKEHHYHDQAELVLRTKKLLESHPDIQPRAVAFYVGEGHQAVFEDCLIACAVSESYGTPCKAFTREQDAVDWFRRLASSSKPAP
jgi:hypothetical protein